MEKSLVQGLGKFFDLLAKIDRRLERLEELEKKKCELEPSSRIIPLSRWNDYHDWPTLGSLRHIAMFRHKNGAGKFLSGGNGKHLVICEKSFFEWAKEKKKC